MKKEKQDLKNCHNCEHLSYEFGDVNDPEGFVCNKREYKGKTWETYSRNESKHHDQLAFVNYRMHGKKCHEKRLLNDT